MWLFSGLVFCQAAANQSFEPTALPLHAPHEGVVRFSLNLKDGMNKSAYQFRIGNRRYTKEVA
jgi:hypothetical protein